MDIYSREIYAHEALVRGPAGEPAPTVLSRIDEKNRYRFDQACRVKAIKLDMELVRNIHQSRARQSIVRAVARMCEELQIQILAG